MGQNAGIDKRYFCLSPLYLPSDWHIPAWFSRVRNGPPLGPCSSFEGIAEQTNRYVVNHPGTPGREARGLASQFVGPARKERRRSGGP